MDLIRESYICKVRFFKDSPLTTSIKWYKVPADRPILPVVPLTDHPPNTDINGPFKGMWMGWPPWEQGVQWVEYFGGGRRVPANDDFTGNFCGRPDQWLGNLSIDNPTDFGDPNCCHVPQFASIGGSGGSVDAIALGFDCFHSDGGAASDVEGAPEALLTSFGGSSDVQDGVGILWPLLTSYGGADDVQESEGIAPDSFTSYGGADDTVDGEDVTPPLLTSYGGAGDTVDGEGSDWPLLTSSGGADDTVDADGSPTPGTVCTDAAELALGQTGSASITGSVGTPGHQWWMFPVTALATFHFEAVITAGTAGNLTCNLESGGCGTLSHRGSVTGDGCVDALAISSGFFWIHVVAIGSVSYTVTPDAGAC